MSFSCKKEKEEVVVEEIVTPIITEEFKINFLNDILSNKEDEYLYPYEYKNPYLMFQTFEYTGNEDVIYHKKMGKPSTFPEFINSYFKSTDTTFIINQLKGNLTLDVYQLSEKGYNIVDWDKIINYDDNYKEIKLVSNDSIKKLRDDYEREGQLMLGKPIFNKKLNKAHISMGYFMSHGFDIIYKKENDNWVFEKTIMEYVN
ncbi:hypothetical protein [Lacinutrix salivirga]